MVETSAFDRLVGARLGNYCLEELIEQNEASSVFKAHTSVAGALFRLRVLAVPPDLTQEERIVYLGRFQQAANQVASLQHVYILPLIDYAMHSAASEPHGTSWPYLVSPHLPVKPLSSHITQKGPLNAILASRYVDQIAAALEYAHQQAVLHCNLTTNCIFINQDGNLLVADFGVIRMLDSKKSVYGINEASAPAPEQMHGQTVDTYTDVYALGAVLYRMLTGHRVFRGSTRDELIQLHLQAPIPSLTQWRSDLPKAVDDVIARAMAKEPAQRFLHPGEVANAYHQIVAPHDTQRVPFFVAPEGVSKSRHYISENVMERGNQVEARISRRRALTFIAGGGGVAAAVLAVAVFGRNYLAGNTSPVTTSPATASPATTQVAHTTGAASHGNVLAHTADLPSNSAVTFPISGQSNPGVIVHLADGRFLAFDSTCTHAGCAVAYSPQDKLLECPCHGAAFDPAKNATVVQGPAQTPLAPLKISVNADGTITQG